MSIRLYGLDLTTDVMRISNIAILHSDENFDHLRPVNKIIAAFAHYSLKEIKSSRRVREFIYPNLNRFVPNSNLRVPSDF